MAKSTRSQDALLAVVVLLTVFAVPALEVYVQITHREDVWGPAVKGLFGLGVAVSIGLGYRKWERDRAARNPEKHLPRPPAATACASCGATKIAFSMEGLVFCDRCGRDGSAISTAVAAARAPAPVEEPPVTFSSPPPGSQAAPRNRSGFDPLHTATLAVVLAFLLGAALVYALFWPNDKPRDTAHAHLHRGASNNSTAAPQDARPERTTPKATTPVANADQEREACTTNARYWCKNMLLDDVDEYRRDGLEPFDEFGKSADINSCTHWLNVQCEFGRATLTRLKSNAPDRFAVWCLKTLDTPDPQCF